MCYKVKKTNESFCGTVKLLHQTSQKHIIDKPAL
nr:MAG TPA: Stromal interaction molecule 1 PROTEIN [Caudoviricetes sp.]